MTCSGDDDAAVADRSYPRGATRVGCSYGSTMITVGKIRQDPSAPRRSFLPASYRLSHLTASKARSYDDDLWDPRAAKGLDWLIEQQLLADVVRDLAPAAPRTCADFACGTGRILHFLSGRFPSVTGIDISAEMLRLARSRCPQAVLVEGDVTVDRDLAPGPFDLITAFRFFLNAEPALRSQALTWMRSALRPGGAVVANFHLNPASIRGRYLRLRTSGTAKPAPAMMSTDEAGRLLEAHGFTVCQVIGYGFLPYRRDGRSQLAPEIRRFIEMRLAGNRTLLPIAGNFIIVASAGSPGWLK